MRLALFLLATTCVVGFVASGPAWGCTCAGPTEADLRESYAEADGAFVGTLVARRTVDRGTRGVYGDETDAFTFAVEEDLKGTVRDRVEVRSSAYGASCGLEVRKGERTGLFVYRSGNHWSSGLCDQVAPRDLREAAKPLPRATGIGAPVIVAGGALGEPRVAAFDADGEVVRYGSGRGRVDALDICPGGAQLAELGWKSRGAFVALRASETLRKEPDTRLRLVRGPLPQFPRALACRDGQESDVFVLAAEEEGPSSTLLRIRAGRQTTLHRGKALAAAFSDQHAYLYDIPRHRLLEVDLGSGRQRVVLRDLPKLAPLAVSPDRERLLAFGYEGIDPTYYGMRKLYVLPLTGDGRERSLPLRRARADAVATWADEDSVGLFDDGETVLLDTELDAERTLPGLGGLIAIQEEVAYGLESGVLRRLDLATGELSTLSQFPVDGFSAMVGIDSSMTDSEASSFRQSRCVARTEG